MLHLNRSSARRSIAVVVALVAASAVLIIGSRFLPVAGQQAAILLAAGDIASCGGGGDEATAALLDDLPGTIVALGDTVYQDGTAAEYRDCYGPSWGRHLGRTRPIPGNHEYRTPGAAAYFDQFGPAAGDPATGYYSFDVGSWHVIALNTQCGEVGGCEEGSPQERWLRTDLAASKHLCTVALMHTPRFSSGGHGDALWLVPFWRALYEAGVEIVLSGDDHDYERFAPQDPAGALDATWGIRQFVVGTGGIGLNPLGPPKENSEIGTDSTHGLLELTLHADSVEWRFVPVAGAPFTDSGSGRCHAARTPVTE